MIAGLFALSIGLAGGLWAVVDAVALRPLPYPDGYELVAVMERHPERGLMFGYAANFADWRRPSRRLPHVAGLCQLEASLTGRELPVRVIGNEGDRGLLRCDGRALALAALRRRDFHGEGRVVILSDGLWQRQFASAAGVSGRVRCSSTASPTL